LLYVDNGSRPEEVDQVLRAVPQASVIRHPNNVGVPRGFNAGLAHALRNGADFVFMANNDTIVAEDCVEKLLDAATRYPASGILVPRISYHDAKDVIWSAGSRYRRFPPSIVMRKSDVPDDPRYRQEEPLEFTTLCTVMIRAKALKDAGLMNPNFLYYCEDYDLALRIRRAGYSIVMIPSGRSWHKVARVTRDGPSSPAFWQTYGRSEGVFRRLHSEERWMTGPAHVAYVQARSLYEGKTIGLTNFRRGYRDGMTQTLKPLARWDDDRTLDTVETLRTVPSDEMK
jgi:GT2 family glycosyltransferase